jgi:hypothetical protein
MLSGRVGLMKGIIACAVRTIIMTGVTPTIDRGHVVWIPPAAQTVSGQIFDRGAGPLVEIFAGGNVARSATDMSRPRFSRGTLEG